MSTTTDLFVSHQKPLQPREWCPHDFCTNITKGQHIDRRAFLKTGMVGAAATALASSQTTIAPLRRESKAPIVLVHGGWHGGWCWKRVAKRLRTVGHNVFTPTLTGVGERVHLAGLSVNLDTHITDVLNVLEAEELSDVVLVGHSYAGMVITGVADRVGGKLRSLVYLDAFVPEDGRNMMDYVAVERRAAMIKAGEASGYLNPLPAELFGITEPEDQEWITRRMTRQPYATFSQPLRLENDGGSHLPRTYVYCSNPPSGSFDQFAMRFRHELTWRFYELKTGHDCMVTTPGAVADIILNCTKSETETKHD